MDSRNRPIGIFDSGVGGLTVVKEIVRILPEEDIVYLGDTARVPYGAKSKETVRRFSIENAEFLGNFSVKLIVAACNTASAFALRSLEERFDIPIVGVIEPGAKAGVDISSNGRIGVIGTSGTISSGIYEKALKDLKKGIEVFSVSCPLFVPLVEEGWLEDEITLKIAHRYLDFLKHKDIDTLILGCTHYPLLKRVLKEVLGKGVGLVDSAESTARYVKEMIEDKNMATAEGNGVLKFYVSDAEEKFRKIGERFLGRRLGNVERM